jgi:hypothetical protein
MSVFNNIISEVNISIARKNGRSLAKVISLPLTAKAMTETPERIFLTKRLNFDAYIQSNIDDPSFATLMINRMNAITSLLENDFSKGI